LTGTFQLSGCACRRSSSGSATCAERARPGGSTSSTGTHAFPAPEHIMAKTTIGIVVCFNFEMERRFACLQGEDVADESSAAQG